MLSVSGADIVSTVTPRLVLIVVSSVVESVVAPSSAAVELENTRSLVTSSDPAVTVTVQSSACGNICSILRRKAAASNEATSPATVKVVRTTGFTASPGLTGGSGGGCGGEGGKEGGGDGGGGTFSQSTGAVMLPQGQSPQ
jgi:hypothetical protein